MFLTILLLRYDFGTSKVNLCLLAALQSCLRRYYVGTRHLLLFLGCTHPQANFFVTEQLCFVTEQLCFVTEQLCYRAALLLQSSCVFVTEQLYSCY